MKKTYLIIFLFITGSILLINSLLLTIEQKPKVAILYVATGRYISFWDNFYTHMEKNFLPDIEKTYFIWTDDTQKKLPSNAIRIYQPQLPWPEPTLKRYHFFIQQKEKLKAYDYLFFLNANMLPLRTIGNEILPTKQQKIMVTQHPGYFSVENTPPPRFLPYDRNPNSRAYISEEEGKYYIMGGFNGGLAADFLAMSEEIMKRTDNDEKNGITALWHDESQLNRYIVDFMKTGEHPLILDPSYAIPEESLGTNEYSFLGPLKNNPKQIILDKTKKGGHNWLRNNN